VWLKVATLQPSEASNQFTADYLPSDQSCSRSFLRGKARAAAAEVGKPDAFNNTTRAAVDARCLRIARAILLIIDLRFV
jgi:hypothetical protein